MFVVSSTAGAVGLMFLSLIALGSWPALFNLTERRGRLPQHTYLDYAIANLVVAVLAVLTLGEIGASTPESPNFITQLYQSNGPSVGLAMVGGCCLCLGNLATQYALAFVGLSITETVMSSITVVIGTTMNFFLDGRMNRAELLFPGVACFLVAAVLGSVTHAANKKDEKRTLNREKSMEELVAMHMERGSQNPGLASLLGPKQTPSGPGHTEDDPLKSFEEDASTQVWVSDTALPVGSRRYLQNVESMRAMKVSGSGTLVGLSIVVAGGVCFGVFSPAFNLAVNDQWHYLPEGVPHLEVYTALFYFSTAFFIMAFLVNIVMLYRPPFGLPKSSIGAWLGDWENRHWALLAGALCSLGNITQFMGGQAAGYAAADSVQALPLVSTLWGVIFFGEYRRTSSTTKALLASMLGMFAAAVALLMCSSGHRKD